jgi:RimJ/RimL family protein N-acetyltransferase
MEIIYRKLKPSESKKYRDIRLESLLVSPDSFGKTYNEENSIDKLYFEKCIENQDKNKFIVGAFLNDSLIGICGFSQDENIKCRHRGSIVGMFVRPEYRQQKIGKNLLSQTIKFIFSIPEIEQINLTVVVDNESANKIYVDAGFIEYGISKRHLKSSGQYFDERLMLLDRSV